MIMMGKDKDKNSELSGRKGHTYASSLQDQCARYIRNNKTISGRLHDELVMMDMDQGKYFSLNPVATRIWELLEAPVTLEALCGQLQEEYEVEGESCREEVSLLLDEMIRLRIVFED